MRKSGSLIVLVFMLVFLATGTAQVSNMTQIVFPAGSWNMTCTEMVAKYNVNAQAAEKVVPPGYTLKLNNDASATLLLATQECSNIVVNGFLSTGQAGLSHAWIQIEGPSEIDPVPGAIMTQPTMYWYYVRGQTDNLLLAATMILSGVQVDVVEQVTLGGADVTSRHGVVLERHRPEVSYSWDETGKLLPSVLPVGVNHRLYREQVGPSGRSTVSVKVRCLMQLYGRGASALTADNRSLIGDLGFDTPLLAPGTMDFTQGCTVDFQAQSVN